MRNITAEKTDHSPLLLSGASTSHSVYEMHCSKSWICNYCWRFLSRSLEPCKLQCCESLTLVPWGRHELESSTSHLLRCRKASLTSASFGSFLCFMAAMVDPISIAEYLSKAIIELKNRSDQVNILKHCYLVSHMTDPNLAAQGESKRVVLDNKRCYQLYLRPTKVEATMQPWSCNTIWWHIASHSPVRFFFFI